MTTHAPPPGEAGTRPTRPAGSHASGRELDGLTVGITSHRRADEFAGMLERHGARVVHAPALRLAPVEADEQVAADTRAIIAARPSVVVVTTGYGIRRWIEAATAQGLGDELLEVLGAAHIICRGGKAQGQVVAAGLPRPESVDGVTLDVARLLVERGVAGQVVAVQQHGLVDAEALAVLESGGATVLTVTPYRWLGADDGQALPSLLHGVVAGEVDVLCFTAAPAVDACFSTARELGIADELAEALREGRCAAAAVGPVTAVPLEELGIGSIQPERFRLAQLVRAICSWAEDR